MTKLANHDPIATVATKNLAAARAFYEHTLGMKVVTDNAPAAITLASGRGQLIVYQSALAGTNAATAVNWIVDDVESVVAELGSRGIAFEHYDLSGVERRGDIHIAGGWKSAWFKDVDGNILCAMGR
jgi:catechol 2,3-dioxygenase-like lactoylglutathione lyase family enzyme